MKDKIDNLIECVENLIDLYVANKDTKDEFICCITPPSSCSMTAIQRQKNKTWSAWDKLRISLDEVKDDKNI